jgi:exodeoxyribonuclease V alpha subunit
MEETTAKGVLSRINYHENGYLIGKLDTGMGVKGSMIAPQIGMEYEFTGRVETSAKWGDTLCFDSFKTQLPTSSGAIRRYLAENCDYVGMSVALALVRKYGEDTLKICKTDPELVAREIKGLTLERAERVRDMLVKNEKREALQLALTDLFQGIRISKRCITSIIALYDEEAPIVIKENPYALIDDVPGYGWTTADSIAQKVGYDPEGMPRIRAALHHTLKTQAQSYGHTALPESYLIEKAQALLGTRVKVEKIIAGIQEGIAQGSEVSRDGMISTDVIYEKERELAEMLLELMKAEPKSSPGIIDLEGLFDDQKMAYEKMCESNVFILTGAPGTGKTHTIRYLLDAFPAGTLTAMAAPTGKAAKRMFEMSGGMAVTIHRLLEPEMTVHGFHFTRDERAPLEDHVIIIDESSMLDVNLAHSLVRALQPGTRLILVGDVYQLPAVGPGNVLKDMINSGVIPTAELTVIKRQNPGLIIRNCHAIKNGSYIDRENSNPDGDMFFFKAGSEEKVIKQLVSLVTERLPKRFGFDPLTDIQVLSAMRVKTPLGCQNLNTVLQKALNPNPPDGKLRFRRGDKVIQTLNDYGRNIINGDIGQILDIDRSKKKIAVEFQSPTRLVFVPLIENNLELAYCITVHKYQGSEAPCVIIPIHKCLSHMVTQRNWIYTAVSRAKDLCVLIGQPDEANKIVDRNRQQKRHTRLQKMLSEDGYTHGDMGYQRIGTWEGF